MKSKTHVIACAVMAVDMKEHARKAGLNLEYNFLEAGLHNNPGLLKEKLQKAIDRISRRQGVDRIIIGYGVCGRGTVGIHSRKIPLVIPKVHDCVAFFLGGDRAYREQFKQYPGTYYLSAGWCSENAEPMSQRNQQAWFGSEKIRFDDLVKSHGEETADRTFKFLNSWQKNYQRAAFIQTGSKLSPRYEAMAKEMAAAYDWEYTKIQGSHSLLKKMMAAETTTRDILVVPPDHVIGFDAITTTLSANPVWEMQTGSGTGSSTIVFKGEDRAGTPYINIGLGIDAGGTYTDAVIYDLENNTTLSKAKSLTTRWDFTIGIGKAVKKLDRQMLRKVELVSLSTTLATNAIVENEGQKVGLILMPPFGDIGEIPHEPKTVIQGELTITGREQTAVDVEQVRDVAIKMVAHQGVGAFAVSGYAGSVNPVHELLVKQVIRDQTGLFVSCGHELSDTLNFQTRAMTAVLNARIIPRLASLLNDLETVMAGFSIHAPIVVVKGDGTLMSADMAKDRPVETILSGPAASVAGARHLTGLSHALVVDMGGTTTDTAGLEDGQVSLNESGSHVGGHRTHVKALEIRTAGLGGDSLIQFEKGQFEIGPKRVAPVSWLGRQFPDAVRTLEYLERNLNRFTKSTAKMQILASTGNRKKIDLTRRESDILTCLTGRPMAIDELTAELGVLSEYSLPLARLEENFMIQRCGLTLTDLHHITGVFVNWDADFSKRFAGLMSFLSGRKTDEMVAQLLDKGQKMLTIELLKRQLSDEVNPDALDSCPVCRTLINNLLSGGSDQYHTNIRLKRPVIGIGAPIAHFLPEAARPLEAEVILPEDGDVANAIGAITSRIAVRKQLRIVPGEGGFIIEGLRGKRRVMDFIKADEFAKSELVRMIRELAVKAGTSTQTVTVETCDQIPKTASGSPVFMARIIKGRLTGRPDIVLKETA